jgi:hypothetical protein
MEMSGMVVSATRRAVAPQLLTQPLCNNIPLRSSTWTAVTKQWWWKKA